MKAPSPALAGAARGRPLVGPETIHVDVTNACNADCITCWDHSPLLKSPRPPEWKARRLDPDTLDGLLDDAASLGGLRSVILSGMGEPLTHPEIGRMIAAVKARGVRLTLISNLLAPFAADPKKLAALGVDEVLASVHAGTESGFRAVHPSFGPGAWDELARRLRVLADSGVACKHVHAICAPNADELVAMAERGIELGAAALSFKLASLANGTEACRIDDDQRARLRERLVPDAGALAERYGLRTNLDLFARQLDAADVDEPEVTAPIGKVGCFVGYVYARVAVDGTVYFCCNTEIPVGTLAAGGARFSELWGSARWNGARERLRSGDYFPGCTRCGKFAQNAKLARRFEETFGRERYFEVTGRGGAGRVASGRDAGGQTRDGIAVEGER